MIYSRLSLLAFLQFFIWGSWLITLGNYFTGTKGWGFTEFGWAFATLGLASIFMPAVIGNIADRWFDARKIHSFLLLLYAVIFCCLPAVDNVYLFILLLFLAMCCYMPSLVLSYSISYAVLEQKNINVVATYPGIRMWGVIGFVLAMWLINLSGNKATAFMFYLSAAGAFVLGLYSLTLAPCPPKNLTYQGQLKELLGLDAWYLFKNRTLAVFLIFAALIAAAVHLSNMYSDTYLTFFQGDPLYRQTWAVKYSTILVSMSQIAEALVILTIPVFFRRFNIKQIIIISLLAWIARFGLFAYGNPGARVWMLILSCVVYGVAADFFMVSASLYINELSPDNRKNSAQGLLFVMTNGGGAILAGVLSGYIVNHFFAIAGEGGGWFAVWLLFAVYILLLLLAFLLFFKTDKKPLSVHLPP